MAFYLQIVYNRAMTDFMKYIGTDDDCVVFVTPSMSHAQLRNALSLPATDAGFVSFRQHQRTNFWGESVSLRLGHKASRSGAIPLWYAVYWNAPYPHVVMATNEKMQQHIAQALTQRYADLNDPPQLQLSEVRSHLLNFKDSYGELEQYGPWDATWETTIAQTMHQTDWGTEVRIVAPDEPAA